MKKNVSVFFAKISFVTSLFFFLFNAVRTLSLTTLKRNGKKKELHPFEEIELGKVKHSVLIRGTDKANPIMLVIHGFAVPMMPFTHLTYSDERDGVEKNFILVNCE